MNWVQITADNFGAVLKIYKEGLDTGIASFETQLPNWEKWDTSHHHFCRWAIEKENSMQGWAALSPVSTRTVYKGVVELSIYIAADARGQGVASQLMQKMIDESEAHGIWTIQSGIFKQNKASRQLHLKHGFREIGYREKVAQRDGLWHDNVLMERRSLKIGL